MDRERMRLRVNGEVREAWVPPNATLLDLIRRDFRLTGTKEGCTTGACGVCTVHDRSGDAILSCLALALEWQDAEITTIEGLERRGELDAVQRAFVECHAVQCGYCTPGVVMSARAVLNRNPRPSLNEIDVGLAGVLCRCTGHVKVREAVHRAHEWELRDG